MALSPQVVALLQQLVTQYNQSRSTLQARSQVAQASLEAAHGLMAGVNADRGVLTQVAQGLNYALTAAGLPPVAGP